jgi:radical SAM superfamily enzyme YgiQ (UPF0313 family)
MKKILLIYPPFCTPASPPYSITNIYSFLKNNLSKSYSMDVIDLNLFFHISKFKRYQEYYKALKNNYNRKEYDKITKEYKNLSGKTYSENNWNVVHGKNPELLDEMLRQILDHKPDIVAFSIVYSSQAFCAYALIKELKKKGIKTVIGGPCVNEKLIEVADSSLRNELELLEYIKGEKVDHNKLNFKTIPDFSIYPLEDYFVPEIVIPIRTSAGCYYKQCTFCTHHSNVNYFEFPLENIKQTIIKSKQKHFFIIDDMISKKRLIEIAEMIRPLNVSWTCQLRPTKDLDYQTLKTLRESGLKVLMWGVESASDRILKLIKKGTNIKDIKQVLNDSHKAGIKNILYIIFGFPTETKEEFLETINFMKENSESIDLISTSIFGLQKGTYIYEHPEEFSIKEIQEEERTVLEPKISYEVSKGLTQKQANALRRTYKPIIEKINKYPKTMNFFREHMICLV